MPTSNSETLDIAIIGAAHPHVEYVLSEITNRTDVRVVAIADHDAARRAELERRTMAPGYADPHALLDAHRVRAAAVFTEFGLRAPIVAELLRRGIFAIADKPMAVTLPQLAAIEETLAGRNLLTLLLEKRFYPVTLALRPIIDSGELGDVVSITATGPHKLVPSRRPAWMFEPSTYGGILADLTVHDIDLALWLTGYTSGTVSGWISPIAAAGTTDFPALGRAILACDNGPQFSIEVDWIQPEASPRHGDYAMRISGQRGAQTFYSLKTNCSSRRRRDPCAKSTCPRASRLPASSSIISPVARPCKFQQMKPCGPRASRYSLRRVRQMAASRCDGVEIPRGQAEIPPSL